MRESIKSFQSKQQTGFLCNAGNRENFRTRLELADRGLYNE